MNPSPSPGRVRGLKGSNHFSPVHDFHFGLVDGVNTPAQRSLSSNKPSQLLFLPHALTRVRR